MARSYARGFLRGNVDRQELLFDRNVFKKVRYRMTSVFIVIFIVYFTFIKL